MAQMDGNETNDENEKYITNFRNNYTPFIWKSSSKTKCSNASVSKINTDTGIIHLGWTGRLQYAVDELEQENSKRKANKDELYRDANYLLEITISTIILMALKKDVPDENYIYTLTYLQNIHDDFGNSPPNILKIINLIQKVTKEKDIYWGDKLVSNINNSFENVTRFPNTPIKSRIPVRAAQNKIPPEDEQKI